MLSFGPCFKGILGFFAACGCHRWLLDSRCNRCLWYVRDCFFLYPSESWQYFPWIVAAVPRLNYIHPHCLYCHALQCMYPQADEFSWSIVVTVDWQISNGVLSRYRGPDFLATVLVGPLNPLLWSDDYHLRSDLYLSLSRKNWTEFSTGVLLIPSMVSSECVIHREGILILFWTQTSWDIFLSFVGEGFSRGLPMSSTLQAHTAVVGTRLVSSQ